MHQYRLLDYLDVCQMLGLCKRRVDHGRSVRRFQVAC